MEFSIFSRTLVCARNEWSPAIGDPHFMGWVTVAAYLLCALAALTLSIRNPFQGPGAWRERVFWGGLAFILLCLAVNKQLDLQTLVTVTGRCHARMEGWYDNREDIQRSFIRIMAIGSFALALGVAWFLRASLLRNLLALLGLCLVLGFVLIRAVSFHDVDDLISREIMTVRVNWMLELSGLILILLAALTRLKSRRSTR